MKQVFAAAALLSIAGAWPAQAAFTLSDVNSTLEIDETLSRAHSWSFDGENQLFEQAFWYGLDGDREHRLGEGVTSFVAAIASDTDFDAGDDTLALLFRDSTNDIDITVSYHLTGGAAGSGTTDIAETIELNNTGTGTVDFRFFQYSDFDLGGTFANDELWFPNANSVNQRDNGGTFALSETVVTPAPTHHQGGAFPSILNLLNDGSATTLSDLPAVGGGHLFGDLTWAYQWDVTLGGGDTFIISKDKLLRTVVPEPGSAILLGLVVLGAGLAQQRRKRA